MKAARCGFRDAELINDAIRASVTRAWRACAQNVDDGADINFLEYGIRTSDHAFVVAYANLMRKIKETLREGGWIPAFCAEPDHEYMALDLCGNLITVRFTAGGFIGSKSFHRANQVYIKNRTARC